MTVSDRPDPAVRKPDLRLKVADSYKTVDVVHASSREVECPFCLNRMAAVRVSVKRDWFVRGALVVAVLVAVLCAWMAWDAHQRANAILEHKMMRDK